ncbi:MAG: hypothetical protein MR739_00200 [Spirochaetia bacterium]|nr:hypothetical protein [Spirochaetia bacterium]
MIKKKIIRIVSSLFLIAALCVGCQQPNGGEDNKKNVDEVLEDLGLSEEGEKTGTDEEIKTISESLKKQGLEEGKDFEITVNDKGETVIKLTEDGKTKLEEQVKVENGETSGEEILVDFTQEESFFMPFNKGGENYFYDWEDADKLKKINLGDTVKIKFAGKLPIDFDKIQVGVYAIKNNEKIFLNKEKHLSGVDSSTNANTDFEFEITYQNTILKYEEGIRYGIEFLVKTQDFSNPWIYYEKGDSLKSEDDYLKLVATDKGINIVLKDLSSLGLERTDYNAGVISVFGVNGIEVSVEDDKKVVATYSFPFVNAGEVVYVKYSGELKSSNGSYWKDNYYKITATSGLSLQDYVINYDAYKEINLSIDREGYKFTTKLNSNGKNLSDYFDLDKIADITADHSLLAGKSDWSNTEWIGGNEFKYDKEKNVLLAHNYNKYNEYNCDIFKDGIPAVWNNENDIEIKIRKHNYLYCSDFRLKFKIDGIDNWFRLSSFTSPEYDDVYKPAEKNMNLEDAITKAVRDVEKTPTSKAELVSFISEIVNEISQPNSTYSSARMVTPSIPATKDYATISKELLKIPSEIKKIVENFENQKYKVDFNKAINIGEIPVSEWFSLIYELNDEINKVFRDDSWEGRSEKIFYNNDSQTRALVKEMLSVYDKYATIKQFYVDADIDADLTNVITDITTAEGKVLSAKIKALLFAGVVDINKLTKEMIVSAAPSEEVVVGEDVDINELTKEMRLITNNTSREVTDFSIPIKAMSMTCGIDADVNLTAEDYKYAQNNFTLSDKSNIDLELEALCRVAVVSSAKNGGIFTINPKINLNTENSSKLLELAVKASDPSAYLSALDNVFDIKIIVQDKDGKETYSDTFKISDVMEIISQISSPMN